MSRLRFSIFYWLLITLIVAFSASAQVPDPVVAAQAPIPGVGHHYIGVGGETVNPADGSLSFDLPLQPPAGRQLSMPFGIHYNGSEQYTITNSNSFSFNWTNILTAPSLVHGWSYQLPAYTAQAVSNTLSFPNNTSVTCYNTENYVFRGFDGAQRSLELGAYWQDPNNNPVDGPNPNCQKNAVMNSSPHGFLVTTPTSYAGWPVQPPLTVTDQSGTTYQFPAGPAFGPYSLPQPWGLFAQTITDKNGNQISYSGNN